MEFSNFSWYAYQVHGKMINIRKYEEITLWPEIWWHDATYHEAGHNLTMRWRHNGHGASQIPSLTIVNSTVYSGADQRKLQSSASLAFVRGIHRGPLDSPHKCPVTRKMFPFDDVIMKWSLSANIRIFWSGLPGMLPFPERPVYWCHVVSKYEWNNLQPKIRGRNPT